MKKILFLLLFTPSLGLRAQITVPTLPTFTDSYLDSVKNSFGASWNPNYHRWDINKNVGPAAFMDTIYHIFSAFAITKSISAKNVNAITAEITSDETQIGYNTAGFYKPFKRT